MESIPEIAGQTLLQGKIQIAIDNTEEVKVQKLIESCIFGNNHNGNILYVEYKDKLINGVIINGYGIQFNGVDTVLLKKKGSGSNGTVMEITFFNGFSKWAIKTGNSIKIENEFNFINILNSHKSRNVVKNKTDYFLSYQGMGAIILESYDTDLDSLIYPRKILTNSNIRLILESILTGLMYNRLLNIIHGDVKPNNIFISRNPFACVLGDYGLAQIDNHPTPNKHICARSYRAPEIIIGAQFSFPVDMWSFGCVLYELVTSCILFKGGPCGHLSPNNGLHNIDYGIKGWYIQCNNRKY
jgi:serine/threonine protein kinase